MTSYKPGEVAGLLGVSVDTVRRLADTGKLPTQRSGDGHRVVEGEDLARYLAEQEEPDATGPIVGESARNRFTGIVTRVVANDVVATVELRAGRHRIVSLMTAEAVTELDLRPGVLAVAAVKSTNVVIEVPAMKLAIAVLAALALPACGDDSDDTLTVLGAASLTDAFTALGRAFEDEHSSVTVDFSFGPSSGLATSIVEGAPADVFASASPATMADVVDAGAVDGEPTDFASNYLEIAVPAGNPGNVQGLEDLAREEIIVGLCAPDVPCGDVAARVFDDAGVTPAPDTEEPDVRALSTKVSEGDVDVGLIYETDVLAEGEDVEGIPLPDGSPAGTRYPIAVLEEAGDAELAREFVALVQSDEGQQVLREFGFRGP